MNTRYGLYLLMLLLPWLLIGCQPGTGSSEKGHDIRGKVMSMSSDGKMVKINHEDIPGVMRAMEMKFKVDHPGLLEGIQAGDQVEGRLALRNGQYVITELRKR